MTLPAIYVCQKDYKSYLERENLDNCFPTSKNYEKNFASICVAKHLFGECIIHFIVKYMEGV